MNSTKSSLKSIFNSDGTRKMASTGAINQGQARPIKQCDKCGAYVVFVQNSKTDKWYLANCFKFAGEGVTESFYYRKDSAHHTICESTATSRNEADTRIAEEISQMHKMAQMKVWMAEQTANGIQITKESYATKFSEIG